MIVCIGDSITTGQGVAPEEAWPKLLGLPVIARGRPGDTTRLALERFPEDLQSLEPDAVVIQFGHNDCNRWQTDRGLYRVSPRSFAANLAEMVERSRTFGAAPYLCTLTPSYRSVQHGRDTAAFDQIVRTVALEEDVALVDVRRVISRRHLMPDGIHLTAEGHEVFAQAVRQVLVALEATA